MQQPFSATPSAEAYKTIPCQWTDIFNDWKVVQSKKSKDLGDQSASAENLQPQSGLAAKSDQTTLNSLI